MITSSSTWEGAVRGEGKFVEDGIKEVTWASKVLCFVGSSAGAIELSGKGVVLIPGRVMALERVEPMFEVGLALGPGVFCSIASACVAKLPKCVVVWLPPVLPIFKPEVAPWGCILGVSGWCLLVSSGRFLGCGVYGWFPIKPLLRGPELELGSILVD